MDHRSQGILCVMLNYLPGAVNLHRALPSCFFNTRWHCCCARTLDNELTTTCLHQGNVLSTDRPRNKETTFTNCNIIRSPKKKKKKKSSDFCSNGLKAVEMKSTLYLSTANLYLNWKRSHILVMTRCTVGLAHPCQLLSTASDAQEQKSTKSSKSIISLVSKRRTKVCSCGDLNRVFVDIWDGMRDADDFENLVEKYHMKWSRYCGYNLKCF